VEKAAGEPFSDFCRERIFEPLGLADTGWFFGDFDASQVARMARPHDERGAPLEHFGFPNWPSGQIRTTTGDLARLWMAVQSRKAPFSAPMLADFETVPFFVQADAESPLYDHGGSEYGVGAYFVYDHAGNGYAFLVNHELSEADSDALDETLAAILRGYSGISE
jgi:CubicO group peptidase (beta-lactamase class C family)